MINESLIFRIIAENLSLNNSEIIYSVLKIGNYWTPQERSQLTKKIKYVIIEKIVRPIFLEKLNHLARFPEAVFFDVQCIRSDKHIVCNYLIGRKVVLCRCIYCDYNITPRTYKI